MIGGVLQRLTGGIRPGTTSARHSTDGGVAVNLYECSRCDDTYVSEGMTSCPACGEPVTALATDRELGMVGRSV